MSEILYFTVNIIRKPKFYEPIAFSVLLLCNSLYVFSQKKFIKFDESSRYLYQNDNRDKAWVPIELNCMLRDSINSDTSIVFSKYELVFEKFSSCGGNSIRLWMGREGFFDPTRYEDHIHNNGIAHFIKIVSLAKKYNLKIKVCLEVARNFTGKGAFHKDKLSKSEGGELEKFSDYLDKNIGRDLYLEKVKIFSKYLKNDDTIYCWELWNEINTISEGDWKAFSVDMISRLKYFFPNHLISVSLGSLDSKWQLNGYLSYLNFNDRDISFVHRYYDLGAEMEICKTEPDVFLNDAILTIKSLQKVPKPIFINETGAVKPRHSGDSPLYSLDTSGVMLHDMIFAPFFSGAIGPGSMWHYWSYIQPNNLWYHYTRFKDTFSEIDIKKENFVPFKLDNDDTRMLGLAGKKNIIIWCKNKLSNINSELVNRKKIPMTLEHNISFETIGINKIIKHSYFKIFNPWNRKWEKVKIKDKKNIEVPPFQRTLILFIRVD